MMRKNDKNYSSFCQCWSGNLLNASNKVKTKVYVLAYGYCWLKTAHIKRADIVALSWLLAVYQGQRREFCGLIVEPWILSRLSHMSIFFFLRGLEALSLHDVSLGIHSLFILWRKNSSNLLTGFVLLTRLCQFFYVITYLWTSVLIVFSFSFCIWHWKILWVLQFWWVLDGHEAK